MRMLFRLLALISLMLIAQSASAQSIMERLVTPGQLSSPHAKLESNCNACHVSFTREAQNGKCLACHKGISSDVQTRVGFHGKSTARAQPCKVCHSEHHGRGFKQIKFNQATFNHSLTNYPLVGGHAKAKCAGCHGNGAHFRGTTTTCATCHARKDPHFGRLGKNCQGCHTVFDWKKPLAFDHTKTGFALTGKHRVTSCMTCHAGQKWGGTPQSCISCHAKNDVHRGSRGTNCASCHSTAGWKATSFNHNTDTAFPLLGRHSATGCAGCHGVGNSIRKPSRACVACHARDDTHKGSRGTNCASCHSPATWSGAKFDHNKNTDFPLLGRHAAASCSACHGAGNTIKQPPRTCIGCHSNDDSHKGRNGANCAQCHNSKDWKVTNFDHDTMTHFALKGAHQTVKCEACHIKPAHVEMPPSTCNGCHVADDPHSAQLGTECASCHNVTSWKEGVVFDHSLTRFPLIGKHAAATCEKCHTDKSYVSKGITCQSCHVDDHHLGSLGAAPKCSNCHIVAGWKSWRFDHDLETSFALTGKHQGLICSACHKKGLEPADAPVECVDCHRKNDIHRGNFGANCARCHVTSSFSEIIM
jgi:hypothetical protein